MLGPDQPVIPTAGNHPSLCRHWQGVVMELNDCAFPLLAGIEATDDATSPSRRQLCTVGYARPRGPGMERGKICCLPMVPFSTQAKP